MTEEESRDIIMENYLHPTNRNKTHEGYQSVNTKNESCIDNINLYIKWNEDKIEDIAFDGEACAVSISSTSIVIKNLIGKSAKEALDYINEFYQMTSGEEYNKDLLKDAVVYDAISKQGNRKVCANLPLKGMERAILEHLK